MNITKNKKFLINNTHITKHKKAFCYNAWVLLIKKATLLLFFYFNHSYAQKKTELDSVQLSYYNINGEKLKSPIDTSLNKIYQYNTALAGGNFFAYTGNIGLAAYNVEFVLPKTGFNALPNKFFCWDFSQTPLSYYNTTKPVTKIDVVFGSKKQLLSNVLHTQNINEFTNVGFIINGLRSDGFSTRQQASSINARVFYFYQPAQRKYNTYLNFDWGRVTNQENGGIRSDSASLFLAQADSRLIPTYFSNAISSRVGGTLTAVQYFKIGNTLTETIDSVTTKKTNTKSKFYHYFSHSDLTNLYNDVLISPEFNVYTNYYEDSLTSYEKIQTQQTKNSLGWNNVEKYSKDSSSVFFDLSISHDYIEIHQKKINSFYNNIFASAEIKKRILKNYETKLSSVFFVSGYNASDYKVSLSFLKPQTNKTMFIYGLNLFSQLQQPDYITNTFFSNHFIWANSFKQQIFNGFQAKCSYLKQAIEFNFINVSNFVFYNFNAEPTQLNKNISIISTKLFSDFKVKKINFSNIVLIQKQLNTPNITRLPFLFSRHTLFYEKILFKKTTPFQAGVEVNFNSSYFANAYMPSSGQFFLQNKQKTGNYATVDFFMSFRIKSAKVFIKTEHLNNKLLFGNYYLVPFYPMHDRSFSAGVSWAFIN